MNKLILTFKGADGWDRPLYMGDDGNLYVDVNPRKNWPAEICTKLNNCPEGEPDQPVTGVEMTFIPKRVTWD